jgi:hypothetical protein
MNPWILLPLILIVLLALCILILTFVVAQLRKEVYEVKSGWFKFLDYAESQELQIEVTSAILNHLNLKPTYLPNVGKVKLKPNKENTHA